MDWRGRNEERRRNPLQNRVTIQMGFFRIYKTGKRSQSPSKPGHNSNYAIFEIAAALPSQSPSKPGHNSNRYEDALFHLMAGRNPLQNRVTIQIALSSVRNIFSGRNPLQNRVTIQILDIKFLRNAKKVAIPFKTGSQFKSLFTFLIY